MENIFMEDYNKYIKSVIITEEQIQNAISETAEEINNEYAGKPLLLLSILKGSFIFMSDFCRSLKIPCEIAFMTAKSYYNGTSSTGKVTITMDIEQDISKYHVIIVEDIIDSGRTLNEIVKILKGRNPLSLRVVTLLDKPSRREVPFKADKILFTIPDLFVIGYGLDYAEYFRNLPYIGEFDTKADDK